MVIFMYINKHSVFLLEKIIDTILKNFQLLVTFSILDTIIPVRYIKVPCMKIGQLLLLPVIMDQLQ